ncbi:MAG: hypothetical protein HXX80_00435 [Nitrososphaerales archaeon]|nr:hypothetical protein [Nitrososphaerales archaeon]
MNRITSIIIVMILLSTLSLSLVQIVQGSNPQDDGEEPQLLVKKNELLEAKYSPMGDPMSKVIRTWFEIYNNNSQSFNIDVIDRIDSINASTLSMLYGTPNPTKLETFGSLTLIIWKDVTIEPGSRVKYQYLADSLREIPVKVDENILVNEEPAEIKRLGELYTIEANISDIITLQVTLNNTAQKLYTNKGEVIPPIACIVSAVLSKDNFSNLKTEPETNSTSVIAGKSMMTWYVFLEESQVNFTISARVSKVGPWGEVPIDPISIQIPSDSSLMEEQLERAIDSIDASIEMMEGFMESIYGFSGAFGGISSAVRQIADGINSIEDVDSNLANALDIVANGIYANYLLLNQSKNYLQIANESLALFMTNSTAITFLNNSSHLELKLLIDNVNNTITYAYTTIDQVLPGLYQLYGATLQISQALKSTNIALDQIKQGLYGLASGLASASSSTQQGGKEMKEPIMDLKDEKEDLEDLILALNYSRNKPYDLEVKSSEGSHNSEIFLEIWKGYTENTWMIMRAEMTNSESYARMVYGLSIQIKANGEPIQPVRVEVLVSPVIKGWQYSAEWRAFNVTELAQIGMEYDSKNSTLYIWSMKRVNASSSENLLVDWLNRPLRIIVESNSEPEVLYEVDMADLLDHVEIEPTESQSVFSIAQPHLIIQNVTQIQPPPSPPPPRDWIQIIIDSLQRPEVQLLLAISILVIGLVGVASVMRRRKRAFEERKFVPAKEVAINGLIKKIESMEKALKDEEEYND